MAFQAGIAIAIAELVSLYFKFDRGYWVTLTAMTLTTQTWGENVKRSFERVGMTILGGVAGTALYFLLPSDDPLVLIGILLCFVFLTVYMLKIYHLISVFFLTCFVVFLFALIRHWDWQMLRIRIYDTALGALIALTVGAFFFSLKTNIDELFVGYLQKMRAVLASIFTVQNQMRTAVNGQHLLADFRKIRKDALSIRYELLFHRMSSQEFNRLLNQLGMSTRYVVNLTESYHWLLPHMSKDDSQMIAMAAKATVHNIEILIMLIEEKHHTAMLPATNVSDLIAKAIAGDPGRFATLESDALGFFNLMYFFTRLNACLNEVYSIMGKTGR